MKVAVTGCTGFLGRHVLAEMLAHEDIDIIAVVRSEKHNLPVGENIDYVSVDINRPPQDVYRFIGEPEVLLHLAWEGLPNYRSLHHIESVLPAQYSFLKSMLEQGLNTLLVPGTCFEYGMQSGALSPNAETHPVNSYGLAKDKLRKRLQQLQSKMKFNLIWARLFYMYGDGQAESSLFPQLKKAVEMGENNFKMSGGEQLRDYLPVKEVATQLVNLTKQEQNMNIVNICSGRPQSVRSLVESWIKENDWHISLDLGFYPYSEDEPMEFWGINDINMMEVTLES